MRTTVPAHEGHPRPGFTLIELVAALVLLSVLMVALTGLIPRFTQRPDDAAAQARSELQRTARVLLDCLARDFSAADSAVLEQSSLSLRSGDSSAAAPTESSAVQEVHYAIEHRAHRPCLMRSQHGQSELLCCGEFRLAIRSFADDGTPTERVALDAGAVPAGTSEIPLASWLELSVTDGRGDLLAQTTVIREPASSALLQVYEERR